MDILYLENLKQCPDFVETFKRPGKYFKVNIEGMELEANYESYKDNIIHIVRTGNNLRFYHWIHAYLAYKYFTDQGKQVEGFMIELVDGKKENINLDRLVIREPNILKELRKLKKGYRNPGSHCRFCKIKTECHKELLKKGDLTVIPSISEKVLKDFEKMNVDPLEVINNREEIDGFRSFQRKALFNMKSVFEDKTLKLNEINLPDDYIVFDVETYDNHDFLFGFLDNDEYIPFFFEDENKNDFEEMIEYLDNRNKKLVHYDVHDTKALRKISKFRPELKSKIDKILEDSLDLFDVILKDFSFPVTSYSLKDISKYFGFEWRTDLNGFAVLTVYQRYLKGDKSVMQKIYDYNEDDCRATRHVLEALKKFWKIRYFGWKSRNRLAIPVVRCWLLVVCK